MVWNRELSPFSYLINYLYSYIFNYNFFRIKVKLGEYNTNKNVTCVPDSKELDCTNPTVDIAVEEIIRQGESSNGPMDFVLLRLVADVQYSGKKI